MMLHILVCISALSLSAAQGQSDVGAGVPFPTDVPTSAARYTILLSGNRAGGQAVWKDAAGATHVFFAFNDRGRGPNLTTLYRSDDHGVISAETDGNDYFKGAVKERYSRQGTKAAWENKAEHGNKEVKGPAFYVSMFGPPEEIAMLARDLLAHGGSLALLPEGEAHIERLLTRTVSANGKAQQVTEYGISGLDLTPVYLWLDPQGGFFAAGETFNMTIREGWESASAAIVAAQEESRGQRNRALVPRLAHQPAGATVFVGVSVFDPASKKVLANRDVLIRGKRIESVNPSGAAPASGAEVIQGRGKMLIPGLWDMHAHVGPNDGLLNLAAGVTTVRDLANDIDELAARKKRIDNGQEIGTRIIAAGFIDGPGPFQGPTKVLASTEQEAREYVRKYAELGYPQIKIYSSLKRELVPVIINEAHRLQMRVSGHIPSGMTASECVKLGQDEIQHANFLFLNFWPEVKETRTAARFTEVAKRAASVNLRSAPVQAFIQLLKEHHVAIDPTLSVFESMFEGRPGVADPALAAIQSRLPPQVARGSLNSGLPVPEGMDATYRASFTNMLKLVGAMYDAGISVESGTDAMAGFTLHRELELHVQAGIPAPAVLADATLGAAKIMSRDSDLGSISPGKLADVVLIDGDPTRNIGDIRKPVVVMKDGVIYKPAAIDEELGVRP